MDFKTPKGWKRESETAYAHGTDARIERRVYRGQEGWFLIPPDLDQEVLCFAPTSEGRDGAFAAFAAGKLKAPRKKSAAPEEDSGPPKPKRGRKPKPRPEPEAGEEEGQPGGEEAPTAEDEDDDA